MNRFSIKIIFLKKIAPASCPPYRKICFAYILLWQQLAQCSTINVFTFKDKCANSILNKGTYAKHYVYYYTVQGLGLDFCFLPSIPTAPAKPGMQHLLP